MKKLLLSLALLTVSLLSISQTIVTPVGGPGSSYQQFGSPSTQTHIMGWVYPHVGFVNARYADTLTANSNAFIKWWPGAQIAVGNVIYLRSYPNADSWIEIGSGGGGGSGTVTTISDLSPLFTVSNRTTTATFNLSNAGAFTLFGRGTGTGAPSYLASIDSNWIPTLHSENYYNTKYQAAGTYTNSVSGTANRITSTGGITPVIDIAATYVGQTSITTLGTITTGTWNATDISNSSFRQSAGLSVVARATNSTGDVADLTAGSDKQVLVRNGTSLVFNTIDSSSIPTLHTENYYNTKYSLIGSGGSGITKVIGQFGITQVNDSTFKVDSSLIATQYKLEKRLFYSKQQYYYNENSSETPSMEFTLRDNSVLADYLDGMLFFSNDSMDVVGGGWNVTSKRDVFITKDKGATWAEAPYDLPINIHTAASTMSRSGYFYYHSRDYLTPFGSEWGTIRRTNDGFATNQVMTTTCPYRGILGFMYEDDYGNLYIGGGQRDITAGTGIDSMWISKDFGVTWSVFVGGGMSIIAKNVSNLPKVIGSTVYMATGGTYDGVSPTYEKTVYSWDVENPLGYIRHDDLPISGGLQYAGSVVYQGLYILYSGYDGAANTNGVYYVDKNFSSYPYYNYTGITRTNVLPIGHAPVLFNSGDDVLFGPGNASNTAYLLSRTRLKDSTDFRTRIRVGGRAVFAKIWGSEATLVSNNVLPGSTDNTIYRMDNGDNGHFMIYSYNRGITVHLGFGPNAYEEKSDTTAVKWRWTPVGDFIQAPNVTWNPTDFTGTSWNFSVFGNAYLNGDVRFAGAANGNMGILGLDANGSITRTIGTPGTGDVLQWNGTNFVWAAVSGTGTVTSVATDDATGIVGGTFTTSGTLSIDTANIISTHLRLQHVIDSLAGTIGGGAAGSPTWVQYAGSAGAFDAEAVFNYDEATNILTAPIFQAENGSASAPTLSFTNVPNTGFYYPGGSYYIAQSVNGVPAMASGASSGNSGFVQHDDRSPSSASVGDGFALTRFLGGSSYSTDGLFQANAASIYSSSSMSNGLNIGSIASGSGIKFYTHAYTNKTMELDGNGQLRLFTGGHIRMAEQSAPSTPGANTVVIYPKSDGLWYGKDDAGTETQLSNQSLTQYIGTGTYTPTLTNTANLDASTAHVFQYSWVTDPTSGLTVVTVSGYVNVDPTTTLTDTQLTISVPIATAFANVQECGGVGASLTIASESGGIKAVASSGNVMLQWKTVDVTDHTMQLTFTYKVTPP